MPSRQAVTRMLDDGCYAHRFTVAYSLQSRAHNCRFPGTKRLDAGIALTLPPNERAAITAESGQPARAAVTGAVVRA